MTKIKGIGITSSKRSKVDKKVVGKEDLESLILFRTDEKSAEKGKDEILDYRNQENELVVLKKSELIGEPRDYRSRVEEEFYDHFYRILGIKKTSSNRRPHIFSVWTNLLIYLRFPNGTLRMLQRKNPKINGARLYKHFQLLTLVGDIGWYEFMGDACKILPEITYKDELIRKFSKMYRKDWQTHLFDI